MSGLLSGVAGRFVRGFDWWIDELSSVVPNFRPAWRGRQPAALTVELSASGALKLIEPRPKLRKYARDDQALRDNAVLEYLSAISRSRPNTMINLRLAHGSYFERDVDIPASAERRVRSILALNLEQMTPFKPAEVYTAHTMTKSNKTKTGLVAHQLIVKRQLIAAVIGKIETLGLKVSSVDCTGPDGTPYPVNFLDAGESSNERSYRWLAGLFLLTALAASAFLIAQSRRDTLLSELRQAVTAARAKSEASQIELEKTAAARKKSEDVSALKLSQTPAIQIIDNLTRLLPDDVALESLKLNADAIDISGTAASAAGVVTIVERSQNFRDAQLTAPVVPDAASAKERFALRATLRQSKLPGPPDKVSQASP